MQTIELAGRVCPLFLPGGPVPKNGFPLVLSNDGDMPASEFDAIFAGRQPNGFVFLAVPPVDRDREYTPWEAPPLSKKSPPFSGGGEAYLHFLTHELLPAAQKALPVSRESADTALVGYSLGGLHALWSSTQCGAFGRTGCLSGSLWYDGAQAYFASQRPHPAVRRIYLSLGLSEEKARNPRMARVGDCTRAVYQGLAASGVPCILEWNPGGHFNGIPGRFQRALDWLMHGL